MVIIWCKSSPNPFSDPPPLTSQHIIQHKFDLKVADEFNNNNGSHIMHFFAVELPLYMPTTDEWIQALYRTTKYFASYTRFNCSSVELKWTDLNAPNTVATVDKGGVRDAEGSKPPSSPTKESDLFGNTLIVEFLFNSPPPTLNEMPCNHSLTPTRKWIYCGVYVAPGNRVVALQAVVTRIIRQLGATNAPHIMCPSTSTIMPSVSSIGTIKLACYTLSNQRRRLWLLLFAVVILPTATRIIWWVQQGIKYNCNYWCVFQLIIVKLAKYSSTTTAIKAQSHWFLCPSNRLWY